MIPTISGQPDPTSLNSETVPKTSHSLEQAISPPSGPVPAAVGADLVYLSDLQVQPVQWLWQDKLAAGTLSMISGRPGSGKTWVALAIAAALSRGRAPVSDEARQPCTTLYVSTEHDGAAVIHPRFVNLNGDPTRLVIVRRSPADPACTLPDVLEDALERTQARLVILDSCLTDTYVSAVPLPQKLAQLSVTHHCCILFLRHLRKRGPGRPIHGAEQSLELSAALRTGFLAGSSPDAPSETALLQVKSNLGPLTPPLAYRIDQAGRFFWTGVSHLTAEQLLSDRCTGAGLPKRKFAAAWLQQYLRSGSHTQYTVEQAAAHDGVCIASLRRAKYDLGVLSTKDGISGSWYWSLPVPEQTEIAPNQAR